MSESVTRPSADSGNSSEIVELMDELTIAVLILVACDLLVAAAIGWTTWAAATGRLRLNQWAGIRTARTMRNQAAWRTGHTAAWPMARSLTVASGICAVAGLLLLIPGWKIAAAVVAFAPEVFVLAAAWPLTRTAGEAADATD